jgi:hypothetical protein
LIPTAAAIKSAVKGAPTRPPTTIPRHRQPDIALGEIKVFVESLNEGKVLKWVAAGG